MNEESACPGSRRLAEPKDLIHPYIWNWFGSQLHVDGNTRKSLACFVSNPLAPAVCDLKIEPTVSPRKR
jgi:hypothetical protein